jgi:hypothetical protein
MEYLCSTTRSNARSADFSDERPAARNEFEPQWHYKKQDKKTPFPAPLSASSPKEITTEDQNSGLIVEAE